MTKERLDEAKAILEKWREKETGICLFKGVPLSRFTKDELITLVTRIADEVPVESRNDLD